jgi:3,4-dihydroxy 2-butanone 4-phosphate synthase/GTP cyclohydrolase II
MKKMEKIKNLSQLKTVLQGSQQPHASRLRPFIAISYAQSIDGSIATNHRRPLPISGRESLEMTHCLRSIFDGILVGINTVLTDDPQLTVRLADGDNPQPVVLDTHLRTPFDSKLLQRRDRSSWLASAGDNDHSKVNALTLAGALVLPCRLDSNDQIDLNYLMTLLYQKGVHSLMVEGGAKVITSFMHAELVDLFIITISPKFIGGLQVIESRDGDLYSKLKLTGVYYETLGQDVIVWAKPNWKQT